MDERTTIFLKEQLLEEYNVRQKDKISVVKNIEKEVKDIDVNIENTLNAITNS